MDKHFVSVIKRIKEIKGLHTDAQVAKALGITKNNLYASKTRDSLPLKHLHGFCLNENIRLDYLLTGALPIYESVHKSIAEPPPLYKNSPSQRIADNNEIRISEIIQKAIYILEGNTPHKNAIAMAIEACYQSVRADEKINEQENKIRELEAKLKLLAG
jgi:hypothetical protein